jgi:transmembrane sensor
MKENNGHIEIQELIVRVLSGEAGREEIQQLEEWKLQDTANNKLFEDYRSLWEKYGLIKDIAKISWQKEWRKFEKHIEASEAKQNGNLSLNQRKNRLAYSLLRIAAVFIIGLFASSIIYISYKTSTNKKLIATTEIKELKLTDGTAVTLNNHSSIKYPKSFKGNYRKVKLEGEAYFEVAHDSAHPFIIEAGNTQIQVLGTSFSVSAIPGNDRVEVIVNSGKVSVSSLKDPSQKIILEPGNKGQFFKSTETFSKSTNDDANFISWKTKKLVFVDEKLEKVISLLNKVYHKELIMPDKNIRNCPITVTFDKQSFDAVLNVIVTTMDLQVKHENDKIIITGKGCY